MRLNEFTGMLVVLSSAMLAVPAAANPLRDLQSSRQVATPSAPGQPFRPAPRDVSRPPGRPSPPSCVECPSSRGGMGRPEVRPSRVRTEEAAARSGRLESARASSDAAARRASEIAVARSESVTPLGFAQTRRPLVERPCLRPNGPTTKATKQAACTYGAPVWEDQGL